MRKRSGIDLWGVKGTGSYRWREIGVKQLRGYYLPRGKCYTPNLGMLSG